MNLTFQHFIREEFNVKSRRDYRRRTNRLLVSYIGEDGYEYRKAFEFPVTQTVEEMQKQIAKSINA